MATTAASEGRNDGEIQEVGLAVAAIVASYLVDKLFETAGPALPATVRAALLVVVGLVLLFMLAPRLLASQETHLGTGRFRAVLAFYTAGMITAAFSELRLGLAVGPTMDGSVEAPLLMLMVAACLRSEHLAAWSSVLLCAILGEGLAHAFGWAGFYFTTAIFAHLVVSSALVTMGAAVRHVLPWSVSAGLVGGAGFLGVLQLLLLAGFGAELIGRPDLPAVEYAFLVAHLLSIPLLYLLGRLLDIGLPRILAILWVCVWVNVGLTRLGAPERVVSLGSIAVGILLFVALEPNQTPEWEEDPVEGAGPDPVWVESQTASARVLAMVVLGLLGLVGARGMANRTMGVEARVKEILPLSVMPRKVPVGIRSGEVRAEVEPGGALTAWLSEPRWIDEDDGKVRRVLLGFHAVLVEAGAPYPGEHPEGGALPVPAHYYEARNFEGKWLRFYQVDLRSSFEIRSAWREAGDGELVFSTGALGYPFPSGPGRSFDDESGWLGPVR